jgi:hypothetical protein
MLARSDVIEAGHWPHRIAAERQGREMRAA